MKGATSTPIHNFHPNGRMITVISFPDGLNGTIAITPTYETGFEKSTTFHLSVVGVKGPYSIFIIQFVVTVFCLL